MEFFAKVDVSCKTEDAEILINDEQKGVGKWGGMMIPGKYTIEVQKDGCHPQSRQVELKDNDTLQVDFPALKTITGSLRVDYEPAGADVLLNGKKVGVTPLVLKELLVGDYHLEIWKEYYVKEFVNVKIAEDQEWKESGELKLTQFGELVVNAENGTDYGLADYYRIGSVGGYRGRHNPCVKDTFHIPLNPVKAIYWDKKMLEKKGTLDSKEAIEVLGPCYPSETDDAKLSFCREKQLADVLNGEGKYDQQDLMWTYYPYAALAWHYFYGIGCKKDLDEARKYMRWACTEKGEYWYPAYIQLIKDMGLDNELKYNPNLGI